MKFLLTLLTSAAFITGAAHAADAPAGGPTISGGAKMNIIASEDIAAGIGNESSASQELGNINSGNISGGIDENETADGDIAAGIGNKSCASQKIGSIGGKGSDC